MEVPESRVPSIVLGSKLAFMNWIWYLCYIWCLKGVLLCLYSKLTEGVWQYRLVWIVSAFCAITWTACVLTHVCICTPVHRSWQVKPYPGDNCTIRRPNYVVIATLSVLSDIGILLIPVPLLFKLRVPLYRKIILMIMFSSGIFIMFCTILRAYYSLKDLQSLPIALGTAAPQETYKKGKSSRKSPKPVEINAQLKRGLQRRQMGTRAGTYSPSYEPSLALNEGQEQLPGLQKESPGLQKEFPDTDKEARSEDDKVSEDAEAVVTLKAWLVSCILSCGYGLSFWPIPVMAAIGSVVSTDLDEPNKYVWFVPLCTVGHIIVASAKNSDQIIAGLAISGFGGANCQMAAFALPELLPSKWRHIGVVIADFTVYIAVIVAPVTARYGYEFRTWTWNFWAVAICQFISFLGLLFFYFPPAHPNGISFMEAITSLDYLGAVLFVGGAVPVLMGIVWAGVYASNDAHVVATLVVGFFVLILFALWETFSGRKFPLTPSYVFTSSWGRDFTAPAIVLGVVNMFYYSSSILWPTMTTVFYTNDGADWKYAVVLSLPQADGLVSIMVLFGSLLGLVTPDNKGTMIAFLFLSQTGFGWALYLSIAITQMGVEQKNLGVSGGISGCVRYAAGAIATAIYTTVFNNTLADWTTKLVPQAAIAAGLSESKVPKLLSAMQTSAATLTQVFSPDVVAAATAAMDQAYCKAIFVVAMVSMAFGIFGIIACACCKDVDHKMTNKIEVYLENTALAKRNKFH
ncbi:hypothetical protein VTN00DRAFT_1885 [Thermoascus crustaceus]|uniref:uncharacterized protein n=1 Tax=Thermoascus crustaceus TaxID=5088 RepID=UPI0037438903